MSDALFADIVAHPDDDDPRLVWADREGGERGELVVIQCALAKGGQSRDELRRLHAREQELLAKPWPDAEGLRDPRFERGFVVHASLNANDIVDVLARHPLVTSIDLAETQTIRTERTPEWTDFLVRLVHAFGQVSPGRIAHVRSAHHVEAERPARLMRSLLETAAGRGLRSLHLGQAVLPVSPDLAGFTELEELGAYVTDTAGRIAELLAAQPRLRRLGVSLRPSTDDPTPIFQALTGLDLEGRAEDFRALARAEVSQLRRLRVQRLGTRELAALLRSERLANLEAFAVDGVHWRRLRRIATSTFAPNLRALTLLGHYLTTASIADFRLFPRLERLYLGGQSRHGDLRDKLREFIPIVV